MNKFTRRQMLATLSMGTPALFSVSAIAKEAGYPNRSIHIIVPYSPGGIVDTIARVVGAKLGAKYGQTVIVENKSGAGGAIGDEFVAKSAPDGYTLLCASPGVSVLPSIVKGLSWSPVRDLRGVEGIGVIPNMFVVLPSMPAKTMSELVALAKKSSTPFTYATAGIGTTNHLSGLLLAQMAGVKLTAVHYRGQPDALNDLLAGRVTMMPLTTALAGPYVKAGKLRGLAVTTATRAPAFPDIPTVAEAANLPGYSVATWFGFVAPVKTPDAVVNKLSADIAEILAMPDVKSKFDNLSLDVAPQGPKQFNDYIAAETSRWSKVLKQDGIEPM